MSNMKDDTEEIFEVVDESGKVIGHATRTECHTNRNLIHRSVHVHVFNSRRELFLQKRSVTKKIQPGRWDTSVGGHVDPGETPEQAAHREMKEELGVLSADLEFVTEYLWRSPVETELVTTFTTTHDGPFSLHPHELDDGRFWSLNEIRQKVGKRVFTPNFEHELKFIIDPATGQSC